MEPVVRRSWAEGATGAWPWCQQGGQQAGTTRKELGFLCFHQRDKRACGGRQPRLLTLMNMGMRGQRVHTERPVGSWPQVRSREPSGERGQEELPGCRREERPWDRGAQSPAMRLDRAPWSAPLGSAGWLNLHPRCGLGAACPHRTGLCLQQPGALGLQHFQASWPHSSKGALSQQTFLSSPSARETGPRGCFPWGAHAPWRHFSLEPRACKAPVLCLVGAQIFIQLAQSSGIPSMGGSH